MIYRAIGSTKPHITPEYAQDERWVFVEASTRNEAKNRILTLLGATWHLTAEDIEIANLEAEFKLLHDPFAEGLTHERALLVCGFGEGKPRFIDGKHGHPLFFLRSGLDAIVTEYARILSKKKGAEAP